MRRAIDAMQKQIDLVIENLRQLKSRLDEEYQVCESLEQALNTFEAQYRQNVASLEERRDYLERQLDECQYAVQMALASLEDEPELLPEITEPVEPSPELFEPFDPPFPNPSPNEEEEVTTSPMEQKDAMKQVQLHFATQLHPDRGVITGMAVSQAEHLMKVVNQAHDESDDLTDLLLRIPWHPAWAARSDKETLGDQWMRLMTWQQVLEVADERISSKLAAIRHNWHYANFETWNESGRSPDFFDTLTQQVRAENEELQRKLDACQDELTNSFRPIELEDP